MKKRRFNWPWIDLRIAVPFIRVETMVMTERFDMDQIDYIALGIQVWKWYWRFRLYRPNRGR